MENSLSGCKYLVPVSAWDSCPVESVVRTYLVAINLWQSSVTINLLLGSWFLLIFITFYWLHCISEFLILADFYHFLLITLYFCIYACLCISLYLCMSLHISVFMHVLLFARRIFVHICLSFLWGRMILHERNYYMYSSYPLMRFYQFSAIFDGSIRKTLEWDRHSFFA